MLSLASKLLARRKAWKGAVSLSAGMLIRDHADGAYCAARKLSRQARADDNEKAERFWAAVAVEIANRSGKLIGKSGRAESEW